MKREKIRRKEGDRRRREEKERRKKRGYAPTSGDFTRAHVWDPGAKFMKRRGR